MAEDNDAFGVMFRIQDPSTYYRFSMDSERHYRRLTKITNGTAALLQEDSVPYDLGIVYDVRVSVLGNRIRAYVNNAKILDYTDNNSPILTGNVALYCWGNEYSHFGDVLVTSQ